jgi:hypothetical protein
MVYLEINMKEKELKDILRRDFDFEQNWKPLFSMIFRKVHYFNNPSNPFQEHSKVKSGKQTGIVKLDDGKSLAIFEVEVEDCIRIDRNRQGLREIAIKHIDQNITHGALVFFFSKNQADYRFSFIAKWSDIDLETGEFVKGETKPKRYTYLLGNNEACTTAAKRLLVLAQKKETQELGMKDIIDAFAVEPLKRDFFKTYKEHYEKFWRYIAKPENEYRHILLDTDKNKSEERREKPIRDFAKKLLGRIVFLHFLQKKGWMGCNAKTTQWENGEKQFMQKLFADFSDKSHFHSKCLTKLFFNTLNTRRHNDIFEIDGLQGKLNGSRVPYLNGGLFDTDKPEAVLHIDFPEKYFAELLDFFEQYNFTIDENSPDDHEVGIDPEMLGHIFENLLEENRAKGAFYTPKEVVQYMCKESIIQYLITHFDSTTEIEQFIRNHSVTGLLTEKDNAVTLDELLSKIKVCDPAIGSGAFPIGMLQEIFEAKKFVYPYLKTNKEFNPAQVKKDIIQNSIYGVDIEKGSVDIAQLRFWLALVVDEETPRPLPNLDFKIMQGNSLLESFEGIDLSNVALFDEPKLTIVEPILFKEPEADYGFSKKNKSDIKILINDYFKIEDRDQKAFIRDQIDRIVREHIDKSLEFYENRLLIEINTYKKKLNDKLILLTDKQKEIYLAKSKEIKEIDKRKKQLANRTEARKKLLDFEKTDERPYFLWHLFFMDVFEKGGFDVMIGNPPYIQLQKMGKDTDILQDENFETFKRTGDIYTLFYEKGIMLLKDNGTLTYITSNTWMRTKFGEGLREFLTKKTNPIKLLNFEDTKIFSTATVEVNILVTKKEEWNKNLQAVAIKGDYLPGNSINDYLNSKKIELKELNGDSWVIVEKEDFEIKKQIEEFGVPLMNWDIEINYGFKTGFNEPFFIDYDKRQELIDEDARSADIIKPLLRGREIHKYSYNFQNNYVIFSHNGTKTKPRVDIPRDYKSIYKHLLRYKDINSELVKPNSKGILQTLVDRADQGFHWTNLRDCAYADSFEVEKIIWLSITDRPAFAFDDRGMHVTAPAYILTSKCNKYLLTMLNSNTMEWYLDKVSSSTGQGTNQWSKMFVEKLPIPKLDDIKRKPFEILADYLTLINNPEVHHLFENISSEIISRHFEEVLNMMVYELYFEEHMKEKVIDVLQFVDFKDISQLESFEEKRDVIQKEYYKLKEKDNPIRNRILVSNIRSSIISRINASTH